MNNATQSTVDIPPFLQEYKKVSTSGVSSNQDDTTAVVTEPATGEPSNSHYTLAQMLKSPDATSPWDGNYVAEKYRNIIRDVIGKLPELMKKGESCRDDLTLDHICIDRKSYRAHIKDIPNSSNTENLTTYRSKFKSLVTSILERDDNASVEGGNTRVELTHFYFMVDKKVTFDDLWYHPLLMSPNERYYFPFDATMTLQNNKEIRDVWKNKYSKSESIDVKATIEKSKCDGDFKLFYEKAKYQDNALGVLDYARDICAHFKQQNSSKKVVEEGLTSLFPERLTYLYEFLYGIDISMQFLIKRRAESG